MRVQVTSAFTPWLLACSLTLTWALEASASEPPTGLSTYVMQGTVGPYLIGMNLTVRDYSQIEGGHYYYATKLIDIPLVARVDGENITLREPGGGEFHLRLTSNGTANGSPNFYNSTGLKGQWAKGDKDLPVAIRFSFGGGSPSLDRWYAQVTEQSDVDFERRVQSFVESVLARQKSEAGAFVSYPLRVNGSRPFTVRNQRELIADWERIFTPKVMAKLRVAIPHEMFVRNGQATISDGTVWFDDRGASAINLPN